MILCVHYLVCIRKLMEHIVIIVQLELALYLLSSEPVHEVHIISH